MTQFKKWFQWVTLLIGFGIILAMFAIINTLGINIPIILLLMFLSLVTIMFFYPTVTSPNSILNWDNE